MHKPILSFKLFRLLAALTPKEYNALRRMAESDFFKTKTETPALFKILKPHHPDFDAPQLSKEFLHKKLFKKQEYLDKTMHDLFHNAAALTEEFLLMEELKSNQRKRKQQLRDIYRKRLLFKEFDDSVEKLKTKIDRQLTYDESDFLELWEAFHHRYFSPKNWKDKDRNEDFTTAVEALDKFYLFLKFQYLNELTIRKKLTEIPKSFLFQNELSTINTTAPPFENHLIFSVFQGIYELYNQPDDIENFHFIKHTLFAKVEKFKYSQQQNSLFHLLNFVFNKINQNQMGFYQEANKLYKWGDQLNLLETENVMAHSTFINVVDIAVGAKDLTWAKYFIDKYQSRLFPEYAENALHYVQAAYHFGRQNFHKTLVHLNQCKVINQMYYLKTSMMYLKTYFELLDENQDADENFNKKLMAFEQYLNRKNDLKDYRKKPSVNGIDEIKLLYKIKNNPNITLEEKEKIKAAFLKKEGIVAYQWIKEKMEML